MPKALNPAVAEELLRLRVRDLRKRESGVTVDKSIEQKCPTAGKNHSCGWAIVVLQNPETLHRNPLAHFHEAQSTPAARDKAHGALNRSLSFFSTERYRGVAM